MSKYLLGIDIGTSSVKAAIYGTDLAFLAEGSAAYDTLNPRTGWAEQNPEDWWRATAAAVRNCLKTGGIDPEGIAALCVSSHAPALVPVGADGTCLRNALIWMDRRSEAQCARAAELIGEEEIVRITGNRNDPYFILGKIMWFKEHEPDAYRHTSKVLQANGYINYRLTGQFSIDKVHASLTGLLDIKTIQWSDKILALAGVDPDLLPDIHEPSEVIGVVSEEAAKAAGLAPGIPVVAGNVDASSSALESGVVGEGTAVDMTGTSTVLMIGSSRWRSSDALVSMLHPFGCHSLVFGPISSTGASLKWFNKEFCGVEQLVSSRLKLSSFELLSMEAEQVEAGSGNLIFLPYLAGERAPIWDTYSKGVFFGLDFNTRKEHMARAILEGTAFALRHNIEEAEKMGIEIAELRAVGGGSRSRTWLQIKASATGKPITTIKKASSGAFGNILLAGAGVGIFDNVQELLESSITIEERFEPDEKLRSKYDALYEVYKSLYRHTRGDMRRLAEIEDL